MKKRVPSKYPIVDGVKTYPDGREVCMTPAAWDRRKAEAFARDMGICQVAALIGRAPHTIRDGEGWTADHKTKRGSGGSTRDDRLDNLRTTCHYCHAVAHDEGGHHG